MKLVLLCFSVLPHRLWL